MPASALGRLRRYGLLAAALTACAAAAVLDPAYVARAFRANGRFLVEVVVLLAGVYLVLGLVEEWVPTQWLERHVGRAASRVRALTVASLAGAWGSGPVWATFPVASLLLASGAQIATAVAFLSAWQVVKLTLLPFEIQLLGAPFALARLAACALIPVPAGLLTEAVLRAIRRTPDSPS